MKDIKGPQPTALPADAPSPLPRLASSESLSSAQWIPCVAHDVECTREHFHAALLDLVFQPELSSSTILRGDILQDDEQPLSPPLSLPGYRCTRRVRRRLLPSRPSIDWAMEQECLSFNAAIGDEEEPDQDGEGLVLLLPDLDQLRQEVPGGRIPYYHPQVAALAFRYFPPTSASPSPSLRLDLLPLPSQPVVAPLPPSDRLYRTGLMLVKYAAKLCKGQAVGWQKRVHHDLLAGKEEVQDLYQELKTKYTADIAAQSPRITFRWMLHNWRESTDAAKHVFEDVAIAAWLIIVWRHMYPDTGGQPPGGFVDVGCGNGLLVFILNAEGYRGYGFDLRERKSWAGYTSPRPDLRVESISPPALIAAHLASVSSASSSSASEPSSNAAAPDPEWPFPRDSFLIGNHADELTPWLALLAACTPGERVAFLNIPCCLHELSGRFERQTYSIPAAYLASLPSAPTSPVDSADASATTYPLLTPFYAPTPSTFSPSASKDPGATITGGRYAAYQLYLAHLALRCGFVPEREALRIPSTKNFGMLGRRRVWDNGEGDEGGLAAEERRREGEERLRREVAELLREVERKGEWKARRPEGKAGEH
ncbi:tRNA (uracil) methyltransferase [Rhodotorula paludigena]|uniref:tRNA (uracil) methyltransferase n=1 Tax=Rhodotorula paludigena TaxID=86838 RepID=UPI00317BA4DE